MSSYIRQDLDNGEQQPRTRNWFGIIAEDVSDFGDLANIVIPEFDEGIVWGGARWQSRDDVNLPRKGDECFVQFDNRNQIWILAWWPFV